MAADLKFRELTEKIIGIFYSVYNELGYGFLESVYEKSMLIALTEAGLRAARQSPIKVHFHEAEVGVFQADLLIEDSVLIELKAASGLDKAHEAQLLNYLRATDIEVGLLMNFGEHPQFKRLVFENTRKNVRGNPARSAASAAGL